MIANPIYREVLPRVLAFVPRASLPQISPTWLRADGALDVEQLLAAFLAFWRQHGQPLLRSAPYHEIAPQLVLMAFLHRVANAGGTVEREYAIGSGRMDLCLRYGAVTLGIELKVWREGRPDPLTERLTQLDGYLAGLGLDSGWLVIFDQRPGQPPIEDRTSAETAATPSGRAVTSFAVESTATERGSRAGRARLPALPDSTGRTAAGRTGRFHGGNSRLTSEGRRATAAGGR